MGKTINSKYSSFQLQSQETLFQGSFPVILPSSGTIGDNGALTLDLALPKTYSQCFMYFPADAIASGVAAGIYYVEMSSTTEGIIYDEIYTVGFPPDVVPLSPTPFSTIGPGAYVQTASTILTLMQIPIEGGIIGPNDGIIFRTFSRRKGSSGNGSLVYHYFGSTQTYNFNQAGDNSMLGATYIQNLSSFAKQISSQMVPRSTTFNNLYDFTEDTTQQILMKYASNILNAATEFTVLEAYHVILCRA